MATRTHCARITTLLCWQNISLCALLISRLSYFHLCYVTYYAVDALLLSYCISLKFCFPVHCSFSCRTVNSLNDCCVNLYVFFLMLQCGACKLMCTYIHCPKKENNKTEVPEATSSNLLFVCVCVNTTELVNVLNSRLLYYNV